MEESEALQHAFNWFLEPLDSKEWQRRKSRIEDHIESILRIHPSGAIAPPPSSISVQSDQIGWYLYLIETYLTDITKYEPTAGARILPTFVRLGSHIELLTQIGGVEARRDRLLRDPGGNPDSGLFELLVALLWKRNDWPVVQLVPETSVEKRPDIRIQSKSAEWAAECKRLSQSSDYSVAERRKWLTMWRALRELLVRQGWAYVFEIVFHVPLETLPDDFLHRELVEKLPIIVSPCTIISNEICEVGVYPVNMEAARRHLEKNFVKLPSDQLNELVAGYRDPNRGFTCVVGGKMDVSAVPRGIIAIWINCILQLAHSGIATQSR